MYEIIKELTSKDDKKAYNLAKEIVYESELSPEFYSCLELFASMLKDKKSYIRVRGFILCCSQARWDNNGKLKQLLPEMMELFYDSKPTVVRQCLNAIKEIVVFRPELSEEISDALTKIDISSYKESMSKLIRIDINELKELIEKVSTE